MGKSKSTRPTFDVFSELWDRLGRVPPERIRMNPPPGTATEEDVIAARARFGRSCELIDGTLVEKTVGWTESRVGLKLACLLDEFAERHDLGIVLGADGMIRVEPEQVRMPDASFFSWVQFPGRVLPTQEQILDRVPDLSVEVLSPSNTRREMERKRRECFLGGCRLVWEIDPLKRTARVYTAPDESKLVRESGKLTGGTVLPGFEVSLAELFARAEGRRPA